MAAPKKAAAKKTAAKKTTYGGGLKLGDSLVVHVNPLSNNGSSEAAATVTRVLNVADEDRVNLVAHVDSDRPLNLRNVLVLSKAPKDDDEDVPTVFATRP